MYFLLLLLPLAVLSLPACAAPPPAPPLASPSQLCEPAIIVAERMGRLPERMMDAIAVVESGRLDERTGKPRPWPWTIYAEGQGGFFATRQQAIDALGGDELSLWR
ncbi:MAG TPA: hypothetical protein VK726_24610 [Acetobacteraceae bacterium]|nr:hypothetical protein [Acetobacteraceae bacterium]